MNWLLIWKYKSWIAIAILSFVCLGQLAYTNHLAGQLIKADVAQTDAIAQAIKPYEDAITKAKNETITKEREYTQNLIKAEQNAIEKIKAANADAHSADLAANSLSKQLAEAKRRVSSASTETIIEYITIGSDVLEHCVAEYRNMAKSCDAERIDKERLSRAWPTD